MKKSKGRRGKGASRETRKKPARKKLEARARQRRFEFLDHPADVGFLARGKTLAELFEAAAAAMMDYGWDLRSVRDRQEVQIRARAATVEDLLFSWLSEILYLSDAERWMFKRVSVRQLEPPLTPPTSAGETPAATRAKDRSLWEVCGSGRGERFDPAKRDRHRARTYIKAVTYHQLAVEETPAGWQATVFLDV